MTSYRFHWRPPKGGSHKTGRLFIRVIHNRRYKDIVRDYVINEDEWDPGNRTVKLHSENTERRYTLLEIRKSMRCDLQKLDAVITSLSFSGDFTVKDIYARFHDRGESDKLLTFSDSVARELASNGQIRTARAYRSAARSMTAFTGRDLQLSQFTASLIRTYEHHLLDRGLKMNTVSFYMRNLRAMWYRAVKSGIIEGRQTNPFEDVFTGVFETRRRALDQQEINSLAALDTELSSRLGGLSTAPVADCIRSRQLRDALKYFMFAFHSRGMSFVDMAYLKKSEVTGNTILYKRKKTGFFIEVKVTKPMRRIINSFKKETKGSQYVFPIIRKVLGRERIQYETGLNRQNRMLKELAGMAGITKTLSTHVARHTWATLAKRMGYSIPLISEGLGHRDIKVTSTYLASFERSALDELSCRISRTVKAA